MEFVVTVTKVQGKLKNSSAKTDVSGKDEILQSNQSGKNKMKIRLKKRQNDDR